MRFALLGDHADGLEMARALTSTGRHELVAYSGTALGAEYLQRWGLAPRRVGDLEEVLADPGIETVIVAGRPAHRPGQLRRALQSERHVLCVCPVDDSPDLAYEAAMIQADARQVLFPLLPEALHPGFCRLAELARTPSLPGTSLPAEISESVQQLDHQRSAAGGPVTPSPTQPLAARLVEIEWWSSEEVLLEAEEDGHRPGFPGWDILRRIGGEIGEVFALSGPDDVVRGEPLLLAGQFVGGGLFQATYLPVQADSRLRVALVHRQSIAELVFAQGWPGAARLSYTDGQGQERVESWDAFNPWAALTRAFEETLHAQYQARRTAQIPFPAGVSWQDAIRALELDDAARRSVHRRRASTLEYQQVTEEASFKGTMTLVGCSLLWISLMLLILSAWLPWLGWIVTPVFGIFLVLQLLRWVVPANIPDKEASGSAKDLSTKKIGA